jgi:hypothetical protein
MRFFSLMLLLVLSSYASYSSTKNDSLLAVLKTELSGKKVYENQKQLRIGKLKTLLLNTPARDYNAQYHICDQLYEEYKSYQFDSAYVYTQKLQNLSLILKDVPKQYESRIKLAFILLSSGMFTETFQFLSKINTHLLKDSLKLEYYSVMARGNSDLADYNSDKIFGPASNALSIKYLDSVIALSNPNSFEHLMSVGDKQLRLGLLDDPSKGYAQLLNNKNLTAHQRAMAATGLSFFYVRPDQSDERIKLLAIGSINDIRSSTKETLAIFKLGEELYRQGDVKDAYEFIQQAMDDAIFYGARLRKIKIGAVLPVVEKQKIIVIENEKNKFLTYFIFIALVALLIATISFVEFYQLRRLRAKEKIIEETNAQLELINEKLTEGTRIKEEYIGYFFNAISGYILKLEKIKKNVERKLDARKYDEIYLTVNEINIKKEREALFNTFDHIFLKIFPDFITIFNSLLKKEDQFTPKDNELLNTDLRIFALMRLGISDTEAIASILEYSVNTIYVYKMRIKAKALVPNDQFDRKIMEIKGTTAKIETKKYT